MALMGNMATARTGGNGRRRIKKGKKTIVRWRSYLHGDALLFAWRVSTIFTIRVALLLLLNGLGHGPYPREWHGRPGRSPQPGVEQWQEKCTARRGGGPAPRSRSRKKKKNSQTHSTRCEGGESTRKNSRWCFRVSPINARNVPIHTQDRYGKVRRVYVPFCPVYFVGLSL